MTRRAEERERDWGERGGKSDWNDFMRSGRCGGVVGDGWGKEARTSCMMIECVLVAEYVKDWEWHIQEAASNTRGSCCVHVFCFHDVS